MSAFDRPHDVVLVRHGQTQWSASGKHTGRTDVALTDLGRSQADALGGMLDDSKFALVLASPLVRAWETMERAGLADSAVAADDLVEWDYGVYEGRRTIDIRREISDWSVWSHPMIDGESVEAVGDRADQVIGLTLRTDGPVAVFGHGTFSGSWPHAGWGFRRWPARASDWTPPPSPPSAGSGRTV